MAFSLLIVGLVKIVPWIVGGIGTIYVTKKVTEAFGNTPANDLRSVGISKDKQFEAVQEAQKDIKKFLEEQNKERIDENKKLKEQLEKLKKQLLQQTEDWKNETDPGKKAEKFAIMEGTKKEITEMETKVINNDNVINANNEKIIKALKSIGNINGLNQEEVNNRLNSPDWTKIKNYGIITLVMILGLIVIIFVKKALSAVLKSFS